MKTFLAGLRDFAISLVIAAYAALCGCACPAPYTPDPSFRMRVLVPGDLPLDAKAQGEPINNDERCWNPNWCVHPVCTPAGNGQYEHCDMPAVACVRPAECDGKQP